MAPRLERASQTFLILLTMGIFGLQSTLAVQTSKGSPFLLSLGLQKPLISLVWTAGPIAGALAQPYFGVLSDCSRSSWGKRRPFIVCGAALMGPSLILLAWVEEITQGLARITQTNPSGTAAAILLRVLAVANIWAYFFGFQMAQVGFRALIVDSSPPLLLDQAMVWATRWNCLGNLVCYGAGFLDLPSFFPWLDASEFQILALLAAFMITFATVVVCWVVEEDNPQSLRPQHLSGHQMSFIAIFREVFGNLGRLSPNIRTIFEVQLYAWAGWFLFNYYITTYVGALHKREETQRMTGLPPEILLDDSATRYGSFALLLSAVGTLVTTVLGPRLIAWARQPRSCIPMLTLRNLWFVAQAIFAICMLSTILPIPFLHTAVGTTALVAMIGMPWALTTWAPFSLIGEQLNILNASDEVLYDCDGEKLVEKDVVKGSGTVISLYIAAINVPQLVATLSSTLVFWLSDNSEVSLNGLGWVMKLSGVAAAAAAWRITAVVDHVQ